MDSRQVWTKSFKEAQETLTRFIESPSTFQSLDKIADILSETLKAGGKIFTCGNGGSHCDAMHFAEELTGRYRKDRKPLGALALGDASHLTCVGNDYGFEQVFSRQLEGLGRKGDVLLALSTSGNSKNQINALRTAKQLGIKTIALLGRDGGLLKNEADCFVIVPAQTSDRIQEVHIKIIHTVIEIIERRLFPELYT